jgi:hypothetical protein
LPARPGSWVPSCAWITTLMWCHAIACSGPPEPEFVHNV